jgi:hypothetical protein
MLGGEIIADCCEINAEHTMLCVGIKLNFWRSNVVVPTVPLGFTNVVVPTVPLNFTNGR